MRPYVLLQSVNHAYIHFVALSYARHAAYAEHCGADYLVFTGLKDDQAHPAWNKVALLLEVQLRGYQRAVWLDADCLVMDPSVNIFTETPIDPPILMARYANETWFGQPHHNSGVIVVQSSLASLEALEWVWCHRSEQRPHHRAVWVDNNWFMDLAHEQPALVGDLPQRFNWMPRHATTRERPVILGLHGEPNRLMRFQQAVQELSHAR
jgi:hypothetical protein